MRLAFLGLTLILWAMVFTVTYKYNLGPTPITIVPVNAGNDPN